MSYNSSIGQILNNTVENTLADSITQIDGANHITICGNRVLNAGDDGISNNSYVDVNPPLTKTSRSRTIPSSTIFGAAVSRSRAEAIY